MAMARVGKGVIDLELGTKGLNRGYLVARDKMRHLGREAAMAGVKLAALGGAIGAIGYKFVKAASDVEEMRAKFDTVFKTNAKVARAWSADLAKSVGRSKFAIEGYMAAMQDTFVPLGASRDKAMELSQAITELTIDLASFNNLREADVLRDLQSALVGNHETVRKYGVIITQTALSQRLMNMGIAGGVKNATEMQKVLGRLNMIVGGTSDAQGDAARTAGSFANQVRALKAEAELAAVAIGQKLMPVAKDMVTWLKDVATHGDKAASALGRLIVKTAELAKIGDERERAAAGLSFFAKLQAGTGLAKTMAGGLLQSHPLSAGVGKLLTGAGRTNLERSEIFREEAEYLQEEAAEERHRARGPAAPGLPSLRGPTLTSRLRGMLGWAGGAGRGGMRGLAGMMAENLRGGIAGMQPQPVSALGGFEGGAGMWQRLASAGAQATDPAMRAARAQEAALDDYKRMIVLLERIAEGKPTVLFGGVQGAISGFFGPKTPPAKGE